MPAAQLCVFGTCACLRPSIDFMNVKIIMPYPSLQLLPNISLSLQALVANARNQTWAWPIPRPSSSSGFAANVVRDQQLFYSWIPRIIFITPHLYLRVALCRCTSPLNNRW